MCTLGISEEGIRSLGPRTTDDYKIQYLCEKLISDSVQEQDVLLVIAATLQALYTFCAEGAD